MARPREAALIVKARGGSVEHPCPPDPARLADVVAALAPFVPPDAEWSYRPPQEES